MAEITGQDEIINGLNERGRRYPGRVSVLVGYTQAYAIYVHENLMAQHPVGQAKFLEDPYIDERESIWDLIRGALSQGEDLLTALLLGGLYLQRESQLLCPVLTGALRASAFTREE